MSDLHLNPYDPPNATNIDCTVDFGPPPVHLAIRVFAAVLTISGIGFVPFALFPFLTPGIFVWIGWLLVAAGRHRVDQIPFWWFSLGWNVLTFWFLVFLRGGYFGPMNLGMVWVWAHLLAATVGSGLILLVKYEARRIGRENAGNRAQP